jgi:hypothetical protein
MKSTMSNKIQKLMNATMNTGHCKLNQQPQMMNKLMNISILNPSKFQFL